MHVNIRSLLPEFVLFIALAHSANPDILAVSESWLRKATKYSEMSIPNCIFRQDRTAKGGGVAIYCRDSLQSSVILSRSMPKQFEIFLLKIHLSRNKSLTVATCYRPPSAPSCALDTIFELITPHLSSEFLLLGDLNWDMLNTSSAIVATPITSLFNLFLLSEFLKVWKAATATPLFKGGDTLDPNCYRPISILPCLSKVFESQVNKRITNHLESHRTFSSMQSGFLAGHGYTSATLKVLNLECS